MNLTIRHRADRAEKAINSYDEGGKTGLVDLLADLMHFCHLEGIDFDSAMETATMHFDCEQDEAKAAEKPRKKKGK